MTIEERANNYIENTHSPSDSSEFQFAMNLAVYIGYVQGAKDQHEIYITKASEWLRENAYFYVDLTGSLDDEALVSAFVKAMEE